MTAIFVREVRSAFSGMMGWLLTAFLTAASGLYFMANNLGFGLTDFGYYTLYQTSFVLLVYVPVLAMRSLADAAMILALRALGCTNTALAANFASLLGYYLLGCAAIALCEWISGLTENQIVAAVLGFAALLLAFLMPSLRSLFTAGSAMALVAFTLLAAAAAVLAGLRSRSLTLGCILFAALAAGISALFLFRGGWLTGAFSGVLEALCLFAPFEKFVNGSFSVPAVVYYLSAAGLFLFFTAQGIEKRRWV